MKKTRAVPTTINLKDAAFAYVSKCCNVLATKPSCVLPKGERVGTYLGAVPDPAKRNLTLGTWRCSGCKKKTAVTRTSKAAFIPVQTATFVPAR